MNRLFVLALSAAAMILVNSGAVGADEPAPATTPATKAPETVPAKPAQPATPTPETKPGDTKPADSKPSEATGEKKSEETPVPATEPKHYYVKMSTSKGDIVIELDNEKAPISTKNFLSYTDKKHYDGTIFHRVIPGFMVQGGNFKPDMTEKKTDAPIKNEWKNGLKNNRGTLSMARTQVADSATSQFFINVNDNDMLDTARDGAAYAVFGRVVSGMDVVDSIVSVPTTRKGMHSDVPKDAITINSVTRLSDADAAKFKGAAEETKAGAGAR